MKLAAPPNGTAGTQSVGGAQLGLSFNKQTYQQGTYQPQPWHTAHKPIEEAFLPPPAWYVDQGMYELEIEKVFKQKWMYVGSTSQLTGPGSYFTGSVFGKGYIISRDQDGSIRAFHNVCPHRAAGVAHGEGCTQRFVCPYHGWEFDLEGRFRGLQGCSDALQGIKNFRAEDVKLAPIRVDVWGVYIFINLANTPDLPPLKDYLGKGGEALAAEGVADDDWVFVKRLAYPMKCNWKVMADNYQDGNYHVYLGHPKLIKALDMDNSVNKLYTNMTSMWGRNTMEETWPEDGSCDQVIRTRQGGGVDQSYSMIYPNFFVNRYGRWLSTTSVQPLGPNNCLTTFDCYFRKHDLEDSAFIADCLEAENEIQMEDMDLCFKVQENLRNGIYDAGRYAPIEIPMWYYHQLLHRDIFGDAPGLAAPSTNAKGTRLQQEA
ncbi:hypothetical protein WJX72_002507 [[Myrmecia] bisecta]|uniref:Choline monooxygenase, chloroplastic n=1 Tax=[Myrmecia] bisecta TaxID=41462 RepID=A0AAW1PGF9_9CHLO